MANPFVGEIRIFAGNFAPNGWSFCNGAILPISEYDTLFTLIGTMYGGDGQITFALPDLRGRLPVHQGDGFVLGQLAGVETVTLTTNQLPAHTHPLNATTATANSPNPVGNLLGQSTQADVFFGDIPVGSMNAGVVGSAGGSQPHNNLMPFLCLNFIISLYGIYPTQ
jgi:microcystin-dependent protein